VIAAVVCATLALGGCATTDSHILDSDQSQTMVRANAEFNRKPVAEPKPYQDFFVSLEKSLFLTAQAVD